MNLEQVKIFHGDIDEKSDVMERRVNEWLKAEGSKITVTERRIDTMHRSNSATSKITIAIFYQNR